MIYGGKNGTEKTKNKDSDAYARCNIVIYICV